MDRRQNIAVVGSGYWGKNLVRNFHSLGALKVVCDKNESVLEMFRQQYPGVDSTVAFSQVLLDDRIDGVVIATPAETHHHLVKEALLAGKHVYVEKPLVLDEAHARELISISQEQQRTLMVGHLLQFHPAFVELKNMVRSGALGRINYIYSNRLNLGKIRREENALWSFAPHDISMILALAEEHPNAVIATGGNYLHNNIADVTTTHLEFPSGLKAHIFVSWLHPFKEQKLVVVGEKKMAVFDDTKPWGEKLVLYPHQINWSNNVPVPDKAKGEHVEIAESEPLKIECQHFLDCIESGCRPLTDGEEGLAVLSVLNLAQRSLDNYGEKLCSSGCRAPDAVRESVMVHESAYVDDSVSIGSDTFIWHFSHVMKGASIGSNCRLGQNVVVAKDVVIGDGCKIQNNVSVYKGVTLEDNVFCGPSMVFTNVHNPRCEIPRMDEVKPTLVKRGASLGANSTIVCGNTIGKYAFVGAGAVVTKDVSDYSLVYGNPAKHAGWMCSCGHVLDDTFRCRFCDNEYLFDGQSLKEKQNG